MTFATITNHTFSQLGIIIKQTFIVLGCVSLTLKLTLGWEFPVLRGSGRGMTVSNGPLTSHDVYVYAYVCLWVYMVYTYICDCVRNYVCMCIMYISGCIYVYSIFSYVLFSMCIIPPYVPLGRPSNDSETNPMSLPPSFVANACVHI